MRSIPRVAPRIPWSSESCSENGLFSAGRKRGQRKRATSKNVKNRQKVSKIVSTLFDIFRAGQKTSKIIKRCQKYFRHFSTFFARGKKTSKIVKKCQKYFRHFLTIFARHQFSGPHLRPSDLLTQRALFFKIGAVPRFPKKRNL